MILSLYKIQNFVVLPFDTIFIKDKSTKKKELRNKITFNERIEYIDIYNSPPLNTLPEEIIELQNITKGYFDILYTCVV